MPRKSGLGGGEKFICHESKTVGGTARGSADWAGLLSPLPPFRCYEGTREQFNNSILNYRQEIRQHLSLPSQAPPTSPSAADGQTRGLTSSFRCVALRGVAARLVCLLFTNEASTTVASFTIASSTRSAPSLNCVLSEGCNPPPPIDDEDAPMRVTQSSAPREEPLRCG